MFYISKVFLLPSRQPLVYIFHHSSKTNLQQVETEPT